MGRGVGSNPNGHTSAAGPTMNSPPRCTPAARSAPEASLPTQVRASQLVVNFLFLGVNAQKIGPMPVQLERTNSGF